LNRNLIFVLAAAIILLDQWTKSIVSHTFVVSESRSILSGFFDLTYVQNRGGAFGIMQGSGLGLIAAGVAVAIAIVVSIFRGPAKLQSLIGIGMALPLGGTIGNMIDRARLGYVVDFFDVYVGIHHWPVFNIADSAICVGVGLIALWILRRPEPSLDASSATKTEG
jgi:signal peptidase II